MRNAGDLGAARDLRPDFPREAAGLARGLGLPFTLESFERTPAELEVEYLGRFARICGAIRGA